MGNDAFRFSMSLGAASAATQIEGGSLGHSWNGWYEKGRIHDGSDPARADDHYARWREDVALMKDMGLQDYRLGVEWARIQPAEGQVDGAALRHYRRLLLALREAGIRPVLTLHHFTNPGWFEAKGGFANKENIPLFLRFVRVVVRALGDLVSEYITINEPNVYATFGYLYGDWPPGHKSLAETLRVISNMAACHVLAYKTIHRMRSSMSKTSCGLPGETRVSFAHHMRVFAPEDPVNPLHRITARVTRWAFQGAVAQAFLFGKFMAPLQKPFYIKPGLYCDFHAVNYYTRSTISRPGDGVRAGAPVNDLGWEIYPEGIAQCAADMFILAPMPIYITENGTCDNEDTFRARYIYDHLKVLAESNLPIKRYYHWCFCDNFEWLEGESARFGLVHIDYDTQKRTVKKSGDFYKKIIEAGGVTQAIYDEFVAGQAYHY